MIFSFNPVAVKISFLEKEKEEEITPIYGERFIGLPARMEMENFVFFPLRTEKKSENQSLTLSECHKYKKRR